MGPGRGARVKYVKVDCGMHKLLASYIVLMIGLLLYVLPADTTILPKLEHCSAKQDMAILDRASAGL